MTTRKQKIIRSKSSTVVVQGQDEALDLHQTGRVDARRRSPIDSVNTIRWIWFGLTLLSILFRLWVAWRTNQRLPDTPARLAGDEGRYDGLAMDRLEGYFFQWPGRSEKNW